MDTRAELSYMNEICGKLDTLLSKGISGEAEELLFTTVDSLTVTAGVMFDARDYRGALEDLRRAIDLMHRYYNENIDFAELKLGVSEIYVLLEDFNSAAQELSGAIIIMKNELGPEHHSVKEAQAKLHRMRTELRIS